MTFEQIINQFNGFQRESLEWMTRNSDRSGQWSITQSVGNLGDSGPVVTQRTEAGEVFRFFI